jgi:hypothetical protein
MDGARGIITVSIGLNSWLPTLFRKERGKGWGTLLLAKPEE